MTDNAIDFEYDGKENDVRESNSIGSSGRANKENATRIPSLNTLPCNGSNMNDSGPLSPLQVNSNSHPTRSKPSIRSRQERIQKATGAPIQKQSNGTDENSTYEEGVSLMSELAMYANAEEEKELKRMIANDLNNNPTILHQSKKLVGYLGGSIRTALQQQNLEEETTTEKELPQGSTLVEDLIGKLGSLNPAAMATGDNGQAAFGMEDGARIEVNSETDDDKSPIPQPKSKYWETLMLRSEEAKDTQYVLSELTQPSSLLIAKEQSRSSKEARIQIGGEIDYTENSTPFVEKKASRKLENANGIVGQKRIDEASPQSMVSIPMDYSLGVSVLETDTPLRVEDTKRGEDNSPGSLMLNMISAATEIETPLVCKARPNATTKSNSIHSSPAVSEFRGMISRATTARTPNLDKPQDSNVRLQPTAPSHHPEGELNQMHFRGDKPLAATEKKGSRMTKPSSYNKNHESLLDKTPITSNKREIFRNVDTEPYLQSDGDISEDASIDSLAGDSSIATMGTGQYLTLQKRIRPTSKPTQSMDRNVHRPLEGSSTSPSSLPSLLGSTTCNEVSDLESPNIINLPLNFKFSDEESTIHSQSAHKRQPLTSPHSLMTVASRKQEAYKIYGIPGKEHQLHMESPQSLMTISTPTVGDPANEEYSLKSTNFKSPKHIATTQTPSRIIQFSTPRHKEKGSPHSTNTDESFRDIITDEKLSGYSKCLRRCITFGMVVALIGSITVLVIALQTPSNKNSQIDNEQESKVAKENEKLNIATSSPTLRPTTDTLSPTFSSTKDTGTPTFGPTSIATVDSIMNFEKFTPTESPVFGANPPTLAPVMIPTPLLRPTTSKVPILPTEKPTSNPNSIPTFSNEKIEDLTWDRIINGENIWRNSAQTPVWYLAADDSPGIQVKVINASKDGMFSEKLQNSVNDYGKSKAVTMLELTTVPFEVLCAPPRIGEIKVCSGDYGNTNWIGSTILFIRDDYIVSALIRINENIASVASDSVIQYELCHQIGHSLGVVHNDGSLGLESCMKDFGEDVAVYTDMIGTNEELQHPSSDDLDYLLKLYGTASSRKLRRS